MEPSKRVKDFECFWADGDGYVKRIYEIQRTGLKGKKIINFLIGDPVRGGLRTPDVINDELVHAAHFRWNEYGAYAGTKHGEQATDPVGHRLKEAIIHREKCVHNVTYPIENVFITSGALSGITTLFWSLMNPEDEWLAMEPIYEYYWWQHKLCPFKWVSWKSDESKGWVPDLDELRSKITNESKGILMVNPNNPTGAVYDEKTLKGIVDIAGEHDMVIISDEVQDTLRHDGKLAVSVASLSNDVPCFTLNSFSKSMLAPGWRMGWLLLHDPEGKAENLRKGIQKFPRDWMGMVATPVEIAAASILEKMTDFQDHLKDCMEVLRKRSDYTKKRMREIEGISMVDIRAGYWGFPKVDGIGRVWKDDYEFARQLLEEEAISVNPGPNWGPTYGPGHFRATLLEPLNLLEEAYNRIDSFLRRHGG